ncbi:hypothetical protein ACGF1Z_04710 [Streptomyces sp. NPDC048018]|uniref:hypothetical protein n=1 Tax=Streptomyces sp. NPDC048018 TaxID=3365499 RepID=UPI00371CA2D4
MQYALDSVAALRQAGLAAAMGNTNAEGIELIQLIASGAPMAEDLAEARLRYRMARWHVSVVLWVDDPSRADALDKAIPAVRSAAAGRNALVARASATSRWIWLSGRAFRISTPWRRPRRRLTRSGWRWGGRGVGWRGSGRAIRMLWRCRRWWSGSGPTGGSPPTRTSS